MIHRSEIIEIGRLLKPHGVKGEITAELFGDIDLMELKCVVVNVDGIFVPFFINSCRPKSADTCLLKFDYIESDSEVAALSLKELYALKSDVDESDSAEEGMYASDLIGFSAVDPSGELIGTVVDLNDDTENTLFIIESVNGSPLLVPAAAEFIVNIDAENRIVELDLPEGLFDL